MSRPRVLVPAAILIVASVLGPPALATTCSFSSGQLSVSVGDGETAILLNDGTAVDVQGASGCSTPISSITGGIAVSGTSGDHAVEVRLNATVRYPVITFSLGAGEDSVLVVGTSGTDTLSIATRFSGASGIEGFTVDGSGGADAVSAVGWAGAVTLLGGPGNDTLTGSSYADTIDGGSGDDTLAGRGGADSLEGDIGIDAADYSASSAGVNVTLGGDAETNVGGDAEGDALSGVEELIGSPAGDTLTGDGGSNSLVGNAGDDVLVGLAGADLLAGGTGTDIASYAASPEAVRVSFGVSAAGGDAAGDQLAGVENLLGSRFADTLAGDGFANRLSGGGGNDTLAGGAGDDTMLGGPGDDSLDGGVGADTASFEDSRRPVSVSLSTGRASGEGADRLIGVENVVGGAKSDSITGDGRVNVLSGGGGADQIVGGGGNDRILGGNGADALIGEAGTDVLDGGKGIDYCDGGPDLDTYRRCDGSGTP